MTMEKVVLGKGEIDVQYSANCIQVGIEAGGFEYWFLVKDKDVWFDKVCGDCQSHVIQSRHIRLNRKGSWPEAYVCPAFIKEKLMEEVSSARAA